MIELASHWRSGAGRFMPAAALAHKQLADAAWNGKARRLVMRERLLVLHL